MQIASDKMIQIAIYGKGGIGKSTISANISYALAKNNKHVMQIGCDPKHDSTRALLNGKVQTTVLSYIRDTPPYERKLEDIVLSGSLGIKCVEAGGPEPGIGCAGRGILSTFDTLKKLGLDEIDLDVKVYDVLGDVVCGGFAVPLRNEYADAVFLVSSGEFMSLYAANNILKGIRNFDKGVPRVAGIILNSRGLKGEEEIVKRFAEAVGLPIIACVKRSDLFLQAEAKGCTVMEMFPESSIACELRKVSDYIVVISKDSRLLKDTNPLDDEQMEQLAKGESVPFTGHKITKSAFSPLRLCSLDKSDKITREDNVVHSCATSGATYACSTIYDAITIIHGPKSCAHIISSGKNYSELKKARKKGILINLQSNNIFSTDMNDSVAVFGGGGLLDQKIRDQILDGHKNIFVVTSCVSGIIGDNSVDIIEGIGKEYPDVCIRVVEADGNISGDWNEGYISAAEVLVDLIDPSVKQQGDSVNIIAERYFAKVEGDDDIHRLFEPFGIDINCRFMYGSDIDSIRNMKRASANFIISGDECSLGVARLLDEKAGIKIDHLPMPASIRDYEVWASTIGNIFGKEKLAEDIIRRTKENYTSIIAQLKTIMDGKKILIQDKFTQDIDWLIELLEDMGAEIILIGVGTRYMWKEKLEESKYSNRLKFKFDYTYLDLINDIEIMKPDMILGDSLLTSELGIRHAVYSRPGVGLAGPLRYAKLFTDILRVPQREGWRGAE